MLSIMAGPLLPLDFSLLFHSWYFSQACASQAVAATLRLTERPQVMSPQFESPIQHCRRHVGKLGREDWLPLALPLPEGAHLGSGAVVGASIPRGGPSRGSRGAIPPARGWGEVKPGETVSEKSGQG